MTTNTKTDNAHSQEEDDRFVPFFGQFFPESLTLAALLAVLAVVVTIPYLGVIEQLEQFSTGFFSLLTVQMSLILFWVLSATVVESRLVGRMFDLVASALPAGSQWTVIYSTGVVALAFGWVNWALGLIGAIFIGYQLSARAEANGVCVHYPAVLTAGLLSLVVTNIGLTSPGALLMSDSTGTTNFLVDPDVGSLVIDTSAFLLHPVNLVSLALFVLTLPALLALLAPSEENKQKSVSEFTDVVQGSISNILDTYSMPPKDEWVFADKLEQSRTLAVVISVLGAISLGGHFLNGGEASMLWLLFALIILGIFIHGRPMAFAEEVTDATRWANHIALPFVMYAAVFSLLSTAGLHVTIGEVIATTRITQTVSYLVAFVLGLLVPSPGSLWVIQGPAIVASGADLIPSLVSVMYGAGVSNLWLGFLFISTIATIHGFNWREYARYAAAITAYVSVVIIALLVVF